MESVPSNQKPIKFQARRLSIQDFIPGQFWTVLQFSFAAITLLPSVSLSFCLPPSTSGFFYSHLTSLCPNLYYLIFCLRLTNNYYALALILFLLQGRKILGWFQVKIKFMTQQDLCSLNYMPHQSCVCLLVNVCVQMPLYVQHWWVLYTLRWQRKLYLVGNWR